MKNKTDLMIMRSSFHSHHHETWFQKKTGLTLTEALPMVHCFLFSVWRWQYGSIDSVSGQRQWGSLYL